MQIQEPKTNVVLSTTRKHAKDPPQKYRYEDKPVPILDGTYGRALGTGW